MIETCPRKRMLLGIAVFGTLTILVLIVESNWTETAKSRKTSFPLDQNSTCWKHQAFEVIKECEPCTAFEIKSKIDGVCHYTHYKELLKCTSGEIVSRSCDRVIYLEEHLFWRFETFMCIFGGLSTFAVFFRKQVLNKRILQRVQRQLANCV